MAIKPLQTPRQTLQPGRQRQETETKTTLRIPQPIDVTQLQSTATTIFTADDAYDFHITTLVASNVSGSAETLTLHLVPSGGSADATNKIVEALAITSNTYAEICNSNLQILLQPGASLVGLCGTNDAVNVWGMGYEYQGSYS